MWCSFVVFAGQHCAAYYSRVVVVVVVVGGGGGGGVVIILFWLFWVFIKSMQRRPSPDIPPGAEPEARRPGWGDDV